MKTLRASIALAVLIVCGCIPPNSDPVSVGEFCIGLPDCSGSILLEREAVGRSRIDYLVRNVGSTETSVEILALVPQGVARDPDAGVDAGNVTSVEARVVTSRSFVIPAGSTESDRFAATELGTRRSIELAVACDACQLEVEYVFETEPLECRDDSDCGAGWLCDPALGRCAECLGDQDCTEEQQCNESGRCDPPDVDAGCSTAPTNRSAGHGPPAGTVALVLFLGGLIAAGRRRRRRKSASVRATFMTVAVASCLVAPPAFAIAPGAGFSLGAGPRWITGELGPVVERGIGISLGQELRWDYVGLGVQLNWAAFLTTQDPPPFSRNVQIFDFTAGPRGYLPIGDFEITLAADYKRLGLAANSLVRLTGDENGYHGLGGTLGGRWDGLGVETRLDLGVHHIPVLNSQLVMFELSFALTAGR